MGITYNGVDVTSVVYNGNTVNDLIYNGTSVFTPGGGGTPVTELSTTAPSGGDPTLADDEVQYFYTGTSAGEDFTALQKDFGEIATIQNFTLKGVTWNDFGIGGACLLVLQTSTDNSYWQDRITMDIGGQTSANYSYNLDVEARYVRLRVTSFANNGQLQVRQWIVNAIEAVGFVSSTAFTSYDEGDSYGTNNEALNIPLGGNSGDTATIAFDWKIPSGDLPLTPAIWAITGLNGQNEYNTAVRLDPDNKIQFFVSLRGVRGAYLTSNVSYSRDQWVRVVVTFAGSGAASDLYVNGVNDTTLTGQYTTYTYAYGSATGNFIAGPYDLSFGRYYPGAEFGVGSLKNFKVYRGLASNPGDVDPSTDSLPAGTSEILIESRNGSGLDNNLGLEFTATGTPAIHEVESQILANVDPGLFYDFGRGIAMSPDESMIAITGTGNYPEGYVQVYNYDGYEIGSPIGSPIVPDSSWDTDIAGSNSIGWGANGRVKFSADGQTLVVGASRKGVVIYNFVNGDWVYNSHHGEGWGETLNSATDISDVYVNSDGTLVFWGQPFWYYSYGKVNMVRWDGSTWQDTGNIAGTAIRGSVPNQHGYSGYSNELLEENEDTLYWIMAAQALNNNTTDDGRMWVYKSTDKGISWSQIYSAIGESDPIWDSGGSNTYIKLGQGITATLGGDGIIIAAAGQKSTTCIELDTAGTELFRQSQDLIVHPLNDSLEGFSNIGVITKSNQIVLAYRDRVTKWDLVSLADRTDGLMFTNGETMDLEDTTTDEYQHNRMFISDLSGLVVYGDPSNNTIFTSKFAWLPAVYEESGNGVLTDQSELPFVLSTDQFALAYDSSIVPAETQQTVNAGTTAFFNESTRAAQGFDDSFAIYRNTEHPDNMKFLNDGTIQFAAPGGYPHSAVGGYIESAYAGSPLYTSDTHLQTPKSGYVWFKPQRVLNGVDTSSNALQILFNDAFYFSTANTPENGGVMFEISGYNSLSTASYIGRLFSPIEATWLTGQDDYGMNASYKMHECRIYKSEYPEYVFEDWHLLVWAVQNTVDGDVARSRLNVWFDGQYYNQTRIYHYANSQPYSGIRPYRYNNKASDGIYVGARSYYSGSTHVNGRNFQGLMGDFKVYVNRYFDLNDAGQIWETTKAKYGK